MMQSLKQAGIPPNFTATCQISHVNIKSVHLDLSILRVDIRCGYQKIEVDILVGILHGCPKRISLTNIHAHPKR
jgi:hypothetical protein